MAGAVNYASVALLVAVMIMVGAEAAEMTAPSPSPTPMDAGAASISFVPSLFAALISSSIPFLASRFY
uniref:Uncharacterized protein n=1 Tax=Picea sitchensis TaxID=3332 RepID=A9NR31_PICSI|nr:unknown [Picea sitchensis]ACN39882.1 unknown [Picea sitchensis]